MPAHLAQLLAVALAYGLAGWASLQLAVPPGYAAPVFPAAGVALAAVLIRGREVLPAIFAGSLLVQFLAQTQTGASYAWWSAGPVALGASMQALVGAEMARRLVGFPNPLDAPPAILRFLAVVAPVSSLICPTVAVPLLNLAGVIPNGEMAFNWWNWWVGDTLGIVVAIPLIFVFFGQPAADWRGRRLGVTVPLGLALLLLAYAFHQVRSWEELRVLTQFNRDAEYVASMVHRRLDIQANMLRSIERLMTVSEDVSAEDFSEFVGPWLERYRGTQNFGWSPLVPARDRQAFEASAQAERPGYRIRDRNPEGETFPAAQADYYLPLEFIEPPGSNSSGFGLNPLSLPQTESAIRQTILSGEPVATVPFRLVQETGGQRGVAVYLAVYNRHTQGSPMPLAGVVSSVFRMDDALAATFEGRDLSGIELCLVDMDAAPDNRRLSGPADCQLPGWSSQSIARSHALSFAGRHWELHLRASREYALGLRSWAAWSTVAVGLLAVGILGAFLLITTGNTRRIAALVERRTAELVAAGARLREQQLALVDAQRIARLGSWETTGNPDGLRCSSELPAVLGCSRHRLVNLESLVDTVCAADRPELEKALRQVADAPGLATLDCRMNGTPQRTVQFQIESEWRDGTLHRIRGTAQDVTDAREAAAHIQYLAHYDALTGLPNRSAWLSHTRAALHASQRYGDQLAVLFLDLDNFKTVNDSLGHPVGDRLLAAVAHRLSACLREEDMLARLGGDEFVALLPRLKGPADAAEVARKMLSVLGQTIEIDGHDLAPSVSIGIAVFPGDGGDVDTLLKHADTAMYGAKAAGRSNYQFFVPEMNARATERLVLENALRRAVDRNELCLHYQPQVDAASGEVLGCEALVRWQHPARGLVPPAHFIPVAEESGLIVPLGNWVLRAACRQQAQWASDGLETLMVAVNISALQFRRRDFVDVVAAILAETRANPRCIELEITESALMEASDEDLAGRLAELRRMGLSLALDDFGTGYSSLAYLKRLPIGRLKIDRSFVKDLPGDPEDAAVASATLSLARDLGLDVVAEGVETSAQRDYLAARGCQLMQGYLYSPPLTAEAFDAWLTERAGT